ncbi:unnamed protein product [Rotaria socialis]|uniref:BED-type domain-containing protein n=1 Tax=Rotaria socialis TaxID=392032 RepID=A0A817UM22_9BILA|nr:unnamed protein product [Rotaria socialis]CAF4358339.1 unnamed protein product [Rotaria socialis]
MHSKTKSKPNSKRISKKTSQIEVELQHVEDNFDEQTTKRTTQQQSVQSSSSSRPKTTSAITTDTDESENQDELTGDKQDDSDGDTLKSEVWNYATKLNNGKAKCNNCNREISCKDHSTTGLRRHLFRCIKIPSFMSHRNGSTTSSIGHDLKRRLNELVYKCIIEDGRTFGDLRNPGIIRLLEDIIPGYKPPTRRTVQRQLKRLCNNHTRWLVAELKRIDTLAVTTDLWSDKKMNSYMCLTGHYINSDSKLQSKVLSFTAFPERHTGGQISYTIKKELKRLQVYDKTHTITCDGAANIKKSFESLKPKRVHCLGHKLHLIVCNALCLWVKKQQINETEDQGEPMNESFEDGDSSIITTNNSNDFDDTHNTDIDQTTWHESDMIDDDDLSSGEDDAMSDDSSDTSDVVNDNWKEGVLEDLTSITCIEQYTINQAIKKCRDFVKAVSKSSILSNFINKEKGKDKLSNSLMIDCKSRWSSTHRLVQSILFHKSIIGRLYAEKYELNLTRKQLIKLTGYELNRDEWIILDCVQEVLNSFFDATKLVSGKQYSTIGLGYFTVNNLKEYIEERDGNHEVDQLKRLLLRQLINYFDNDADQYDFLKRHAFFDPIGFGILDRADRTKFEREIRNLDKERIESVVDSDLSSRHLQATAKKASTSNLLNGFLSSVG